MKKKTKGLQRNLFSPHAHVKEWGIMGFLVNASEFCPSAESLVSEHAVWLSSFQQNHYPGDSVNTQGAGR